MHEEMIHPPDRPRRLVVRREAVRRLTERELAPIQGGATWLPPGSCTECSLFMCPTETCRANSCRDCGTTPCSEEGQKCDSKMNLPCNTGGLTGGLGSFGGTFGSL